MNVGVVGLGIGEQHARAYLAAPGCELRWLFDLDRARLDDVRARLGAGAAADSLGAILGDPATDLVSLASYDDAHAAEVEAALLARKHVFVEKPLCRTPEELDRIARAWRASGRALSSNLVLRAAPLYVWLRQAIVSGELGEVYAFDGDYLYGRVHKITEGWRKDVVDYSVMQGGGVHLVDLMIWLTGQRPERVSTVGNRLVTRDTAYRYDDFRAATFVFGSGLIGRITANFGCVHRHQHVVRIFGTKATFVYDDAGPRLHRVRADGHPGTLLGHDPLPASKGALIPAFVSAIQTGDTLTGESQTHLDVVAACIAADRAAGRGYPEDITYV